MSNLRDRIVFALNKMLTLPSSKDLSVEDFNDQWKILVYDEDCRDIISPVMNVGALRQKGVTLHLLINIEREPIPDAPAVYFVRPTESNIKRIIEDCSKQLYRNFHLHFLTRIERPLLEKLANELVVSGNVKLISKIIDQYLDCVVLEPTLFSLNIKDSFISYNDPSLSESQIRSLINRVSVGLLSMIRVLGSLPIIRSPVGGAAEMLAQGLLTTLKENISPRGPAHSLFADSLVSDRPRPLLLIFDRNSDIFPILQHTSTYQALVDDLLDHRLNRVTIDISTKDLVSQHKKKTYDLNTQVDLFYGKYCGSQFPEAVEANEKELAEVSQRESEIKSKPGFNSDLAFNISSDDNNAKGLSEAIESLPEILNRKANLEAHTNILEAVMSKIASREVPTYFEIEQNIVSNARIVDKPSVLALLKDGSKGKLYDKARLLLLVVVSGDVNMNTKSTQEEFDSAFRQGSQELGTSQEIDNIIAVAAFLRQLQALQTPLTQRLSQASISQSSGNAMFTSLLTTAQSKATSLMAKVTTSLFTKFNPMFVTRVVDNLSEGRSCIEDDTFTYYDPRLANPADNSFTKGSKYSEVIVFVIGGGCYSEYYNLQELIKQKQVSSGHLKSVIYGCSELLSGDKFLQQLVRLVGNNSNSNSTATNAKK